MKFSIPDDQSALLDRYDRGEISRQEYLEESNKNWQRAAEEYGTIPEGEKAAEKIPTVSAVEDRKDKGKYICRFRLEQLFFKVIQYLTI